MEIIKKMSGHSGCEVYLMIDPKMKKMFIRKISSSVKYNQRLKKQMIKQQKFKSSFIKKPSIFSSGFTSLENLFYFDMEYVPGVSFFDYIQKQNIDSVKVKFKKILSYIYESNEINENISEDIINKLNNLKISSKFDTYKNFCLDFDWTLINKSYCHGDLTFENIIISNDNIYFIDFLDSFTDTKLIDYSKLYQELYAFWSYRNKNKKFNIKYIILDEMIKLSSFEYQATIRLLILSLMRIVPYSNEEECVFLEQQMKYILENINE